MLLITSEGIGAKSLTSKILSANIGTGVLSYPLLKYQTLDPDLSYILDKTIICTSPRIFEILLSSEYDFLNTRIIAVGSDSYHFGMDNGFRKIEHAANDVNSLIQFIKKNVDHSCELVYLRAVHISKNIKDELLQSGFSNFTEVSCYRMDAESDFSEEVLSLIKKQSITGIVIMSKRSAVVLNSLIDKYKLENLMEDIRYYVMSRGIASVLGRKKVLIAKEKSVNSLKQLITEG
ncbi:hypothetical protein GUI12_01330 [Anaplasmataceae bacterium AB001_6]|nr:hypothetical protein GUI12_01330 [Anaplasmataceae bacterium AB001_6]